MPEEGKVGLRRGIVELHPYTAEWAKIYKFEEKMIKAKLGRKVCAVEHVGSTSVPGLLAKPIIDIAVAIEKLSDWESLKQDLIDLGYEYMPSRVFNKRVFFPKGSHDKRTHYIHIVEYGGEEWQKLLGFRDYMRNHPKTVKEYNELKKSLAKIHRNDRETYTAAKEKFISGIMKKLVR